MIQGCLCLRQIPLPLNFLSLIVRSKPLARLKTRISSHPTSTTYLLRRGVDFASTQRIDISCFCWQSFPLVFTHHLPMKVPVVISLLCLVVFQIAKQLRHVMLESVAISRPVQLLSLRLKHATCLTDTTPGKNAKTVRTIELQQKKLNFLCKFNFKHII